MKKWIVLCLSMILFFSSILVSTKEANAAKKNKLEQIVFGQPEELTAPLDDSISIFNGAVGKEDGHHVMYTTTKGFPAKLNVLDLNDYKLLRTIDLEGAENTWAHEVLPNGDLYIATIGGGAKLWKYSPVTKKAAVVASFPGETFPFSITSDSAGNVYVGTYPSGKVFQYKPESNEVIDYGRMIGEISQEYIRSLAIVNETIYSGTGHGKIIKYNTETGEKSDIAEELGEPGHVYDLNSVDDRYLFARFELSSNGYLYDTQTQEWLDIVIPNVRGLHVEEESLNNKVYFMTTNNELKLIDLTTLKIESAGIQYESGFRGVDWVEFNTPELPGKSLVTINFSGYVAILNLETKKVVKLPSLVKGTPTVMQAIEKGPGGKLYISGMQTGKGAIYDPATGTKKSFNLGQGDSMGVFGDKMLMGVYPEGDIREYDPALEPSSSNPKRLFTLGEEQNRISDIESAEGKAFIGSIPFYGELGGALTVYDPASSDEQKHKVFRNVVEDQSVMSLAYKEGKVFGSTTINGGLGVEPTAQEAKIFVWDVKNEKKIKEVSLAVEGIEKPEAIGELSFGPDGLLWGAVKNAIFALNPETLEVVKSKKLYPDGSLPFGVWHSIALEWSKGLLYAGFSGNLTAIDSDTLESKRIANAYSYDINDEGDIYYSLGSNRTLLYKMTVDQVKGKQRKPLQNHSFEKPIQDGVIPGWTSMFTTDSDVQYDADDERRYKGRKSLKLIDSSRNKAVALMSQAIDIKAGDVLTAESKLFIKDGLASFMLRYYDENGKEIISVPVHTEIGYNKWQTVSVTAKAPENVVTARVIAYTTSYATTTAFYDDIKLWKLKLKK
ncbi:hypothetical protein [Metabacillus arenae]|uniref:Uncharacterized protein n=1 Tax=Metabacillus arenae TaxID=2771434 RepID=A0A926NAA4_9BACI|nr:hypothetical protein [Metabacillus arenae]MBD1380482.1 hypothetical protein [Metabacillus arenae]